MESYKDLWGFLSLAIDCLAVFPLMAKGEAILLFAQ
jgi:hypothetical protein